MASPFQQQALQRKVIYILLIVGLFTVSLLFRNYVVEARADELALREQNLGAVELSGSAIRLSLTGLRGVASAILWMTAIERQKKNQWDELEILVHSITKLQPHFIQPWLFQTWNLSYNVSVKCDLPRDKYFYIARGIQFLAEGERQNQYQPELRFSMGTYYHQKISNHDHKVPLQALFEMSFMDPVHRRPAWLKELDRSGRPRYETFLCQQHPRLVRRLREKLRCTTIKQVLEYLEENKGVPRLFGDKEVGEGDELRTTPKLNREQPFPVLPPPLPNRNYVPTEAPSQDELGGDLDAIAAARTWFAYAQEPLPEPDDAVPGVSKPIADRIHQREPVHMTTIIFRDYAALAQTLLSDRLEEEGWYDDTGWKIPPKFFEEPYAKGAPTALGTGRKWGEESWSRATQLWTKFGEANHMLLTPEELDAKVKLAERYYKKYGGSRGSPVTPLRGRDQEDAATAASYAAADFLTHYDRCVMLTNFAHQYERSRVESKPETVATRKELYDAEQDRLAGRAQALKKYEEALKKWAKTLADNAPLRSSQAICEDSFELEWNYLQLFQSTPTAPLLKQQLLVQDFLGQALLPGPDFSCVALSRMARPQAVAAPQLIGPLDGNTPDGQPIIEPGAMAAVLRRKGLLHEMPMPPSMQRPGPGMGPRSGSSGMPIGMPGMPGRPGMPGGSSMPGTPPIVVPNPGK
jgi:hypothetical protein